MKKAFTLIELLVVVLIIGILAAVALPQYRVAVAKSRLMQSLVIARAVYEAEEAYYLANNTYTSDVDDLDIGIGAYTPGGGNSADAGNYYLSNNYRVAIYLNAYGGPPDRVEVYLPNSLSAMCHYFDHPSVATGHDYLIGKRVCFGEDKAYQQACLSMGGTYMWTIGGTEDTRAYQLP